MYPLFHQVRQIPYDLLPHGPEFCKAYYSVIDNAHLFPILAHTLYYNAARHEMLVRCFGELTFHLTKIVSLLSTEVIHAYMPTRQATSK